MFQLETFTLARISVIENMLIGIMRNDLCDIRYIISHTYGHCPIPPRLNDAQYRWHPAHLSLIMCAHNYALCSPCSITARYARTLAQGGHGGGVGQSHIWMVPVRVCTDHFLKTNFIPQKGHLATQ